MSDDLNEYRQLKEEINSLFEAAEKERYVHSRSKETFDSIAGLWFLGDAFQSALARISNSYIVSSFLLNSLGLIYERMRFDYGLPEFSANALTDDETFKKFLEEIGKLKADGKFVQWLKDTLLPRCEELLHRVEGNDLESVARIGNLADSTEHIARQYASREDGDTWVYDSVFQFSDELIALYGELTTYEKADIFQVAYAVVLSENGYMSSFWRSELEPIETIVEHDILYDPLPQGSATNIHQQLREVA